MIFDLPPSAFKQEFTPGLQSFAPPAIAESSDLGSTGHARADHTHAGLAALDVGDDWIQGRAEFVGGTDVDVALDADERTVTWSLPTTLTQDYTFSGTVDIAGLLSLTGDLDVGGVLSVDTIAAFSGSPDEPLTIVPVLWAEQDVYVAGTLMVDVIEAFSANPTGAILLNDPTEIASTLTMGDDIVMAGFDITGAGALEAASLALTGDASIADTLRVDVIEPFSASPSGDLLLNCDVVMGGDLDTAGNDIYLGLGGIGNDNPILAFAAGPTGAASFAGHVVATGALYSYQGILEVGRDDTVAGAAYLYGGTSGGANGGQLYLYTAEDHDTSINYYIADVYEDDFRIIQHSTTKLTLQGSDGTWLFGAAVGMGGNAITGAGAITGTAITGTSFVIGGNTLTTSEWAFLDGQDQAVAIASSPTFANVYVPDAGVVGVSSGCKFTFNASGAGAPFGNITPDTEIAMGGNSITGAGHVYVGDDGTMGISGDVLWTFDSTPATSQIELTAGALMIGDAQRIYFENSGTTQGTDYIESSADGTIQYRAATRHYFRAQILTDFNVAISAVGLSAVNLTESGGGGAGMNLLADWTRDQFVVRLADARIGRQMVLGGGATSTKDYDHAVQTNPTLFGHDITDPDISNNKFWYWTHDGTGAVCGTGANTGAGSAPATIDNYIMVSPRGAESCRFEGDGGLLMATTNPVRFRDAALHISSPGDGIMALVTDGTMTFGAAATNQQIITSAGLTYWIGTGGVPYAEIWVRDNVVETVIGTAGTYVQFVGFTNNGPANNATPDHTQDHITIGHAGVYEVICSLHLEGVGGGAADLIEYEIRSNNGTVIYSNLHGQRKLAGGGGDSGSLSISGLADFSAGDTVEVWITDDDNATNVIVDDANLSVHQVGG